jgi:protein-S-isoprenylcysteine O-methyltransferase Ste14
VYGARVEDRLLKGRFGKEWEEYARKVGFILPKLRRQ